MNIKLLILFTQLLVLAELCACITGFVTRYKWKQVQLKWFPIYLLVITLLEVLHHLLEYYKMYDYAAIMYVIAVPLEMFFISWFFYHELKAGYKKITFAGALLYAAAFAAEKICMQQDGYFFKSLSYTIGNLFILIYLILFFIELVKSDSLLRFKQLASFWIACGMLLFYLGSFPFYGLYNELAKDIGLFIKVAWVATFLNYCMYLFFIIAFIWGKPG